MLVWSCLMIWRDNPAIGCFDIETTGRRNLQGDYWYSSE